MKNNSKNINSKNIYTTLKTLIKLDKGIGSIDPFIDRLESLAQSVCLDTQGYTTKDVAKYITVVEQTHAQTLKRITEALEVGRKIHNELRTLTFDKAELAQAFAAQQAKEEKEDKEDEEYFEASKKYKAAEQLLERAQTLPPSESSVVTRVANEMKAEAIKTAPRLKKKVAKKAVGGFKVKSKKKYKGSGAGR